MPTNRTRRSRGRITGGLTVGQIEHLISGHNFFDQGFPSEDECGPAWEKHKDEVIDMQGKHPHGFGYFERPWAWWKYEATEMRRIIQGIDEKAIKDRTYKGMWSEWNCSWHEVPEYESERAYLERLNLLNERELALLESEKISIDKF